MYSSDRCLIDNWSLEHAGYLLNGDMDNSFLTDDGFIKSLGGLSNYINAVLLYDEAKFVANGFQTDWYRFHWFEKNTRLYIHPFIPTDNYIDWNNHGNSADLGAKNYLLASKFLDADLLISPERARQIITNGAPQVDDNFIATLEKIDEKIRVEKEELWYENVKVGIEQNFVFPSLIHYVLSEASNMNDLLTVIMQLKASGDMTKVRKEINDLSSTTKGASRLKKEVENIINNQFSKGGNSDKPWSISFDVLFLTISKSFNFKNLKRKSYLTFLKDFVACRAEAFSLKDDIQRIFGRKIELSK